MKTTFTFFPSPEQPSQGLVVHRASTSQLASVKFRGFTIEPAPDRAISGLLARPPDEPLRATVWSFARSDDLLVSPGPDETQRDDVPNDTAELKATFYISGARDTTVQTAGLPGIAHYRFARPTSDRLSAGGAEVAVKGDGLWYRTVLITHHEGTKAISATGDYTKRSVVWAGATGDPVGGVNEAYRYLAAHFADDLTWSTYRTNVTSEGAYLASAPGRITEEDGNEKTGAIWGYFKGTVETSGWVDLDLVVRAPDGSTLPKTWIGRISSPNWYDCKYNVTQVCIEG